MELVGGIAYGLWLMGIAYGLWGPQAPTFLSGGGVGWHMMGEACVVGSPLLGPANLNPVPATQFYPL